MSLLRIDDLWAGYSGRSVLKGISLAVEQGNLSAIVGPNGHGKTTLLKCISGLVRPTRGSIHLGADRLDRLPAFRVAEKGITHIPQGDLVFTGLSIEENLRMGAYLIASEAETRRRLDEVFSFLPKLGDRRWQVAGTLSGGERRMLGIGRGLMADGRILLIDEPSLGLAPIIIEQVYEIIGRLKEMGRSILLVEESVGRVLDLADCVILLDNGHVVWRGASSEVGASSKLFSTYLGI